LYRAAHARLLLQHPNPKTVDLYRTLCRAITESGVWRFYK
jgi:hypothetical protein